MLKGTTNSHNKLFNLILPAHKNMRRQDLLLPAAETAPLPP